MLVLGQPTICSMAALFRKQGIRVGWLHVRQKISGVITVVQGNKVLMNYLCSHHNPGTLVQLREGLLIHELRKQHRFGKSRPSQSQ